jgi:hypothetical protein
MTPSTTAQVLPHFPSEQTRPASHVVPHVPQLLGSCLVSEQRLPHLVVPPAHSETHSPLVQTSLGLQAVSQDPQWSWSIIVIAHLSPQKV